MLPCWMSLFFHLTWLQRSKKLQYWGVRPQGKTEKEQLLISGTGQALQGVAVLNSMSALVVLFHRYIKWEEGRLLSCSYSAAALGIVCWSLIIFLSLMDLLRSCWWLFVRMGIWCSGSSCHQNTWVRTAGYKWELEKIKDVICSTATGSVSVVQ